MSNTIKLKRGSGSDPSASDLAVGEVAVRTDTGKLFTKKDNGNVAEIGGSGISDGDKGDITVSNSGDTFTIDSGVVTESKIGDNSITLAKMGNNSVDTNELVSGAVTNAKVASNAAIAGSKISPDFGSQNITTTGAIASGDIEITGTAPSLALQDSNDENDFAIKNQDGTFKVRDVDAGVDRFTITTAGVTGVSGNLDVGAGVDVTGNITVTGTVDGVDIAARNTLFGGLTSSSGVLTNGVTATTQSASDNSTKVATTAYTDTAIANLVDSAPGTLNTLNELAAALGDDPNFATTVTNSIATKMPLAGGTFTGDVTFQSNSGNIIFDKSDNALEFSDNNKAKFGGSGDLQLYHSGSDSFIDETGAGDLKIRTTNGNGIQLISGTSENMITCASDGSVELYEDGTKRIETTTSGANIIGNLTVSGASNSLGNTTINGSGGAGGVAFTIDYNGTDVFKVNNVGQVTVNGTVDGRDLASDGSKLDGIESGATADQSASEILTLIKTVDGSGSGLDADTLDGVQASGLVAVGGDTMTGALRIDINSTTDGILGEAYTGYFGLKHTDQTQDSEYMILSKDLDTYISASSGSKVIIRYGGNDSTNELQIGSGNDALTWRGNKVFHAGNDGSGSGLDADLLDGQHGSHYLNYNNLSNKPTVPTNNNQLTNGAGYITSASFSDVAGGGTFTGDISVSGGAAALNVNANSDIRFTNGTWTGNATKIQHHDNALYIGGGSNGIRFREGGTDRIYIDGDGNLRPAQNNAYDLGSTSRKWKNVYTMDLHLSNEGSKNKVDNTWGNYTIQEGESDLFLLNNRNGKMYKFMLQEVS